MRLMYADTPSVTGAAAIIRMSSGAGARPPDDIIVRCSGSAVYLRLFKAHGGISNGR